jgi:putative drug exporter of the RND superfamily
LGPRAQARRHRLLDRHDRRRGALRGPGHAGARAGAVGARQGGLGHQRRDRQALRRHRRRGGPAAAGGDAARGQDRRLSGIRRDLAKVDATLERALPGARIASFASTGDRVFASKDGRTAYALVYPGGAEGADFGGNPDAARAATDALAGARVGGEPVHVTGFDALEGESGGNEGPGVLLEAIIGGAGALVVLLFVFASFLAVVPLLMAIVAIMTTFVLLLGLTELTAVSPIVQFLIVLIGLGVAIDYALLVVSRWRE